MFKCPDCQDRFKLIEDLYEHIEEGHESSIPSDYTVSQYYYYKKTGKVHGNCVVCKKPTEWNPSTNKYHRFCKNPDCKEKYREEFKKRMIGKYGKVHLLNDPDQQKKMLANRKISGTYIWSDGTEFTYTGTYELDFLKFLDKIMQFESSDIIFPSPHVYRYIYNGEEKFYMPDGFICSLGAEVEIKESDNTHPKIQAVDKVKEKLKDEVMTSQKSFNYIKLVDKNNIDFLKFLDKLKDEFEKNPKKPRLVFQINDKVEYGEAIAESVVTESNTLDVFETSSSYADKELIEHDIFCCLTESEDSSKLNKNFKSKGQLKLSSFNRTMVNDVLAKKYNFYCTAEDLKYLKGYVYTDKKDGSLVAIIAVATYTDGETWIQPIRVSKKYRGYGLSKQLMDVAIHQLGAKYLAVYSDNEIAIKLYKEYGFRVYRKVDYSDGVVYCMSIESPQKVKYIKENYIVYENMGFLTESTTDTFKEISKINNPSENKCPIFVILTYTGSLMAKAIKGVTREAYSHASISFDSTMKKMYSFGQKLGGFVQESFDKGYFKEVEDRCTYSIYVTFVTEKQKEAMQKFADKIASMKEDFKFNIIGLFTLIMGKESHRKNEYFCSQFVADVLDKGTNIIKRDPSLYAPMDLIRNKNFKFVSKGVIKNYDKNKVDRILKEKFNR